MLLQPRRERNVMWELGSSATLLSGQLVARLLLAPARRGLVLGVRDKLTGQWFRGEQPNPTHYPWGLGLGEWWASAGASAATRVVCVWGGGGVVGWLEFCDCTQQQQRQKNTSQPCCRAIGSVKCSLQLLYSPMLCCALVVSSPALINLITEHWMLCCVLSPVPICYPAVLCVP